jgi:hypothetical protein
MTRREEPEFYAIAPRSYKQREEKSGTAIITRSKKKKTPGH